MSLGYLAMPVVHVPHPALVRLPARPPAQHRRCMTFTHTQKTTPMHTYPALEG